MPKYHYKNYLNRAFWNSFLAVMSAFVLVLIIVLGWQEIRAVMDRVITGQSEQEEKELDRLELLETLKGDDSTPVEDKERLLEELRSDEEEEVDSEQKLQLLESLKSS